MRADGMIDHATSAFLMHMNAEWNYCIIATSVNCDTIWKYKDMFTEEEMVLTLRYNRTVDEAFISKVRDDDHCIEIYKTYLLSARDDMSITDDESTALDNFLNGSYEEDTDDFFWNKLNDDQRGHYESVSKMCDECHDIPRLIDGFRNKLDKDCMMLLSNNEHLSMDVLVRYADLKWHKKRLTCNIAFTADEIKKNAQYFNMMTYMRCRCEEKDILQHDAGDKVAFKMFSMNPNISVEMIMRTNLPWDAEAVSSRSDLRCWHLTDYPNYPWKYSLISFSH